MKSLKTVRLKLSTTTLLTSLLATCSTSPCYAEITKVLLRVNTENYGKVLERVNTENNTEVYPRFYVEYVKVQSRVNDTQRIAKNYQYLNNDSFILVDMVAVSGNNSCATPHCLVRFGDLFTTRRTTAPISGFLLRAIQSCPRYDGLDGDTFGCAGSCVPVRQPRSVCHLSLATFGDGFITHTQEVNHD